ncbi:hypothetical protein [Roseburia intestinalis]|jgi:hypothetical protein|uniref:Uncharacterized protein n=1 Tax=Roseburia intestinalis L1-82 TaxID=536231 RepID=C7GBY6_9FIRM|nr:hypothetical protein [Roseburia intestinalis]EEV00630.1 hypothetical protein ROSINTL182_07421 [Roseburia intestinalis L1-82]UWP53902.1 hypothetical protein NQ522_11175 [Roseburia intestinalis]VCV22348.1 hypothetical protein RIL182_02227 [Roseburia intestinalis L1-82]VUE37337.1 hypothetical protein [Roseburia phage Jekyll]
MKANRNRKRFELLELLDPIKKFYKMNSSKEIGFMWGIPVIVMIISLLVSVLPNLKFNTSTDAFANDILGSYITIMTLFVSFTMGYLSILITSNSENINELKTKESKYFVDKNGDPYKLFQILMSNITYAVIVEILFLISSVMEKYLLTCINSLIIKWICALDAGIFTHIVIVLLTIIKNIYYSFWKPE